MTTSVIGYGGNVGVTTARGLSVFAPPAAVVGALTGSARSFVCPVDGTVSVLRVRRDVAEAVGNDLQLQLRVNDVDAALK